MLTPQQRLDNSIISRHAAGDLEQSPSIHCFTAVDSTRSCAACETAAEGLQVRGNEGATYRPAPVRRVSATHHGCARARTSGARASSRTESLPACLLQTPLARHAG